MGEEILELNTELDIETVLEHLIENNIIEPVNDAKNEELFGSYKWLNSPKQKWI